MRISQLLPRLQLPSPATPLSVVPPAPGPRAEPTEPTEPTGQAEPAGPRELREPPGRGQPAEPTEPPEAHVRAWLEALQLVTLALARALTPEQVARAVVDEAVQALGARDGGLFLLESAPDGAAGEEPAQLLRLVHERGYPPGVRALLGSLPLQAQAPMAHAVRAGMSVWLESGEACARAYPQAAGLFARLPPQGYALACLPLQVQGRSAGVLALAFPEARRFPQAARGFLEALAQQASMALERAQLYAQAQEAVRLRDVFLSIASHELNTPLTALKLQLASARRAAAEVGVEERLGAAERQVDRLGRLVRDLLDVSRLSEGRLRLEPAPMDLTELAREVLQRFEPEASSAGARLLLEAQGAVQGLWDRSRLDQVLTNLVSNALKYGRGRPVALRVAARAGGGAQLWVRDQGIGIPLAQQGRLFQRFERASGSERVSGLGLGLWISRQMVEAHGGRIHLHSQAGAGTTVCVELPPEAPPAD